MTLIASYTLSPQWAFNRWLVALLVFAAGALVVYLYRAQQKVASRAVVVPLTTIRLLLVLLMFVLLAGLSVRWSRTASSGGTLWLLVDSSASMGQSDPRATPVEKLRWADALGFLPADFRPSKLDRQAARLGALRADRAYLRSRGELPSTTGDASGRAEFAAAVREWGDRLRAASGERAVLIELADRARRSADKGPVPWAEI